jgi:cation transporter-like permease
MSAFTSFLLSVGFLPAVTEEVRTKDSKARRTIAKIIKTSRVVFMVPFMFLQWVERGLSAGVYRPSLDPNQVWPDTIAVPRADCPIAFFDEDNKLRVPHKG